MTKAEWSGDKGGFWLANFQGRNVLMSFCVEEVSQNCFEASYCFLDENDYVELGTFENLKLAKKALEAYAIEVDTDCIGKRS